MTLCFVENKSSDCRYVNVRTTLTKAQQWAAEATVRATQSEIEPSWRTTRQATWKQKMTRCHLEQNGTNDTVSHTATVSKTEKWHGVICHVVWQMPLQYLSHCITKTENDMVTFVTGHTVWHGVMKIENDTVLSNTVSSDAQLIFCLTVCGSRPHSPISGTVPSPGLSRRRTAGPPCLIRLIACAWGMSTVLRPLISIKMSPTLNRTLSRLCHGRHQKWQSWKWRSTQ